MEKGSFEFFTFDSRNEKALILRLVGFHYHGEGRRLLVELTKLLHKLLRPLHLFFLDLTGCLQVLQGLLRAQLRRCGFGLFQLTLLSGHHELLGLGIHHQLLVGHAELLLRDAERRHQRLKDLHRVRLFHFRLVFDDFRICLVVLLSVGLAARVNNYLVLFREVVFGHLTYDLKQVEEVLTVQKARLLAAFNIFKVILGDFSCDFLFIDFGNLYRLSGVDVIG